MDIPSLHCTSVSVVQLQARGPGRKHVARHIAIALSVARGSIKKNKIWNSFKSVWGCILLALESAFAQEQSVYIFCAPFCLIIFLQRN